MDERSLDTRNKIQQIAMEEFAGEGLSWGVFEADRKEGRRDHGSLLRVFFQQGGVV